MKIGPNFFFKLAPTVHDFIVQCNKKISVRPLFFYLLVYGSANPVFHNFKIKIKTILKIFFNSADPFLFEEVQIKIKT